jgi:hypothetical protein
LLNEPSLDHQYQVGNLNLENIIVVLLKSSKSYLTDEDNSSLSNFNALYKEMVNDLVKLKTLDFSKLQEPRIGFTEQDAI